MPEYSSTSALVPRQNERRCHAKMGNQWSQNGVYHVENQERRVSSDRGIGGGELCTLMEHEEEEHLHSRAYRSPSGDHVIQESTYTFTVRDKCLSGPPPVTGRRRSSLINFIGQKLGGNFTQEPEDMVDHPEGEGEPPVCTLSSQTQTILRQIFHDLDPSEIVDYHVHLVGHGDSGSGCHLHHSTKSWMYPIRRLKTVVFMAAAQVPDMDGGDVQYISRLVRLVKHFVPASIIHPSQHGYLHGKFCLLPFDEFYEKNGIANRKKTTFYVPNKYALQLSKEFPDYFYPFGSVNPYRHDALKELERCAGEGVTVIKWLPNSMGINPDDKECEPFYLKMKELDMALLVHVGDEHSVDAAFLDNRLGNPLLLRRPLDCGVKVIAAHCATEGYVPDLDRDAASTPCFHLLLRLMRERKYKDLLFADISAVCAFRRVPYLPQLLQATDVHDRLVYGSDYPVPAINLVVHTSKLVRYNLISQDECNALNELYNYNPLLFDVASKRLLRGPNGEKFPTSVFKAHPKLPPYRRTSSVDPAHLGSVEPAHVGSVDPAHVGSVDRAHIGSVDPGTTGHMASGTYTQGTSYSTEV